MNPIVHMYSTQAIDARCRLRQKITEAFPSMSPQSIYDAIKPQFSTNLTQEDLLPYAKSAGIDESSISILFAPYGIHENRIGRQNWKTFFEDEFANSEQEHPIPSTVDEHQAKILTRFANSIRMKQGPNLSDQWIFVLKHNPTGANPNSARLSAFCHISEEQDFGFTPKDLVRAVMSFYGTGLESLSFEQFSLFMQTFVHPEH